MGIAVVGRVLIAGMAVYAVVKDRGHLMATEKMTTRELIGRILRGDFGPEQIAGDS